MKRFYSKHLERVKQALRSVSRPRAAHHHHHVPRRRWRVPRRHVNVTALMVGGTIAAIFFFIIGIMLRLLIGPISLGPFASAIEDTLNASVSGLVVHFDEAMLEWSQSEGRVNLSILGAKIFDKGGHIIAQAPKAELDFNAGALLAGRTELRRFALIGVQVTAVRTKEGTVRLGFRSIEGESDLLGAIAGALQNNGQTFAVWGKARNRLDRFAILDARLAFHDETTGLFIVSPSANLTVTSHDKLLEASLDAVVEISGVRANVVAEAELLPNGMPRHGALEIHGLSLNALAANSPAFAGLAPFGLTLDLTGNVDLKSDGTVRSLDFGVSGSGVAGRPKIDPVVIGISNFRMLGRFDGATKRLALDEFSIQGDALKAKAVGHLDVAWKAGTLTTLAGELDVENCAFNIPDRFAAPVSFDRMALRGAYDYAAGKITLDNAVMSTGPLQANLKGTITLAGEQSPAINAKGTINPIAVRDFLRYWPVGLVEGARSWIAANVSQGHIGQAVLDADIPAGALDQDALPETSLSLTFPFSGVTAQYIKSMTPLTGGQGEGHLSGDTFRADVTQASVGPLAVSKGSVVIPELHTSLAPGTIAAHAEGKVSDVLALIDEQPLGYPKRFHIDPKATAGDAILDLSFTVPMLKDLDVDQLGINVQAKTVNLSLPLGEQHKIDGANLAFAIDGKSLVAQGLAQVNGVPLNFKWTEDFNAAGMTTRVDVTGTLDEIGRGKLGLPDAGLVFGPSQVAMSLVGHRAQFASATMRADLREAEISVPTINLEKPPGQPAGLTGTLRFGAGGAITVQNFVLSGNAIDVRGAFTIDAKSGLASALLPIVRVGANDDFSVMVKRGAAGGLDVSVQGKSFDASHVFTGSKKPQVKAAKAAQQVLVQEDTALKEPLLFAAKLDRVLLNGGVVLTGFNTAVAFGANAYLQNFALDAVMPNKEHITGKFTPQPDGSREIALEANDAGTIIRGLTGFVSMRKGTLAAHATLASNARANTDLSADYKGKLVLRDFAILDQPFFARLFAVALQQGRGISFDKLEAPFSAHGKVVTIEDGRGSGSTVGVSFAGQIDRRRNTVDISGTMVPIYGLNSMLGDVPLLGNILASRKGEGMFGLTYTVRGDLDKPSLLVNPLSVLTPGIFRRIFEFATPTASLQSPAARQPEAPTATAAPAPSPVEVTPLAVPVPKPKPEAKTPY